MKAFPDPLSQSQRAEHADLAENIRICPDYVRLLGFGKPSTVPANAPASLRPIAVEVGFVNTKGRST